MNSAGAPLDEKGQHPLFVIFKIQSFPFKQSTIGTLSRTGRGALELDAAIAELSGELGNVARMRGPAYQSRLGQLSQIAHIWRSALLRVWRDDFEIVPFTKREKCVTGPAARMNATENRADSSAFFDEGDAAIEIVAAEKNMIKHDRRTSLSRRESWGGQGSG
jgi:hypothetical protein